MDTIFASPAGGSAQPVQDISQQVPVQPPAAVTKNPIQSLPQQKGNLRKFFNISSWVVLFALLPLTVLIFLSQDSIPGDTFYPVKRNLENIILTAASVSPATRAAFRTDLTERRFKEAQGLVVSQSNANGLITFIDDVRSTKQEVANLKDDAQRVKAEEKLISKLEEYQAGLSVLEAKTEQNIITYQFQESPTLTPLPAESDPAPAGESTTAVSSQNKTSQSLPSATPTLILAPTLVPTSVPASSKIQPTFALTPSSTFIPTIAPTVVSEHVLEQENVQIMEQKRIAETIKNTKERLDKIKNELEKKRKDRQEGNYRNEKVDKEDKVNKEGSNRQK